MRGMIIPLWREGIVILLFAEWWKGRNKTQSPDSTVEKLFLSLFFPCMYIFLLLFPLSLSLSLCIYCFYSHIVPRQRCATTLRFRKRSQISCRFLFAGISNFPPLRVVSSGNWIPSPLSPDGDLFWRNLYRLRSSGNATLRGTAPPPSSSSPSSWQLYNEISRVGPPDRFLPRKRLIRLRRSGEKIVDKNDMPLSGRLLRALALLSSPSWEECQRQKERLNRDLKIVSVFYAI